MEQENHLVVFVPVERMESVIPPLDEIKDKVVADWTSAEALRLVQLDAAHFIQRANADWGQALAELPAKAAVTTGRSPLASRAALPTTDPALNGLDYLSYMTSICTVAKPGLVSPLPVAGKDAEGRDGVFVLRLADFKAADESLLSGAMLDSYIYMMMMSKRAVMNQAWGESLYQASSDKIVVADFYMN